MNRLELKNKAKEQLQGKRGILAVVTLISVLLSAGINIGTKAIDSLPIIIGLSIIVSIVSVILQYGISKIYLNVAENKEVNIYDIFLGFTSKAGIKSIGISLLLGLIILLPSVLVYVIGIFLFISLMTAGSIGGAIVIAAFIVFVLCFVIQILISIMYSQSIFILCEDNNRGVVECINLSRKLMKGHKREYLVLLLSFIGWILLMAVTCGIASLYVAPYMSTVYANYYLALKGSDAEADNTINI